MKRLSYTLLLLLLFATCTLTRGSESTKEPPPGSRAGKNSPLTSGNNADRGNDHSRMIAQQNRASEYQAKGEYDSSLLCSNIALGLAISLHDPVNTGKIYTDIGTTCYYMGKSSEALDSYEKALKFLLPSNDKKQLAKVYNNMASTYMQISYYEKATKYFLASARMKEELADSNGLAAAYNNLGLVYFNWDNNEMAGQFLKKAISINLRRNNRQYLATNYTAMGDLFVDSRQADSAIVYYRKSLELKTATGNKYGIVISLHCLADVYSGLLKNEARAIEYYRQALSLANSIESATEIAILNMSLGEIAYRKGNLDEAGTAFRKAYKYASRENSLELIQKSSRYLTEISIRNGDYAGAREYFSQYRVAGDSLFDERKTKVILEMQTRFESEKKEQENLLLQKTNDFQKSMIEFLVAVAVMLAVLGLVIFILYRQKNRAFRQIVSKNLEIVVAEKQLEEQRNLNPLLHEPLALPQNQEIENTTLGLLVKFERLMENEKPYLDPGLTVDDICKKINTNRSYLSRMIHESFNQNFNGFINELRIKEARRLLADARYDHLSIEGLGNMAGFSTKVTFHSTFKKQIGVTPSFFRNSIPRKPASVDQ